MSLPSDASTTTPTITIDGNPWPVQLIETDVISWYPRSVVSVVPDPNHEGGVRRTIIHTCKDKDTLTLYAPPSTDPDVIRVAPQIAITSRTWTVPDGVSVVCTDKTGKRSDFKQAENGYLEIDPSHLCRETDASPNGEITFHTDVHTIDATAEVECAPCSHGGNVLTLMAGHDTRLENGKFRPNAKAVRWREGDDRSRTIFG